MPEPSVYVERTDPEARRKQPPPAGIQGWGADLDPANRPGVPKERTPPRLAEPPPLEPQHNTRGVTVFHSTERPGITPVYGTSMPPSGLSGLLRRAAFRYSENDLRHWLILLAADRINVGEGLIEDLAHGHIPNLWAEMGGPAAWKYDRAGVLRKAAIAAALAGLAIYLLRRRRADTRIR